MNFNDYFNELKRRNVIKSAIAYLVVAWLVTQVLSIVLPAFGAPDYLLKWSLVLLAIGFPIWLSFAWVYEFTPEGLKKTIDVEPDQSISNKTGSRLNRLIITTLTLAIIVLLVDRFTRDDAQVVEFGDKSIAVMAFADMSPKQDHEYFSDGISEELLNLLAKIPELKVISRTSSFSYKGKDAKATEIGDELKVSHILEGSIRKAGDMIRVTAQLINTNDGAHVWSHTYDRKLDGIFKIQDEIAAEVGKELKLSLLDDPLKSRVVDSEAYNLYLQARHLINQNTKDAYIEAEAKVKASIALDATYAASWRLLAGIYDTGTYNFSIYEPKEGIPLGLEAIKKAIAIDPDSGYAYATLASLQELAWDFEASAKNMDKALDLLPNDGIILGTAANKTFGDLDKSVDYLKKAIELDPLVYVNYFNLGHAYYRLNRLDEAEKAFQTFGLYYPNWEIYHFMITRIRLAQNRNDEALEAIEKEKHEFFSLYGRNFVLYALNRTEEADALFEVFLEKYSATDPANIADLYAFRGNYEASFKWLNRAFEVKDPVLIEALTYPSFKPMYSDSRWSNLIDKIGLPADHGYPMN
ncbi:tetratricopeptide repeat protein [Muriicola sp. Z0-33]|uniref:tetratricopeptide repeat protein n=1 Tax=Muriicola sp. Z0-33 TaxID=2816957 RepID=UPI002238B637|nr:tetratricopeptide repeat protein [Muriicola sp. Z0-33]MCW5515420.1 tetratricopeptide repeat protein [Muriicola sp. Z0-33]